MGWVRDEVCTSTSVGARYTPKMPSSWRAFRTATTAGSLMSNSEIVTRPIWVSASKSGPSQIKCSVQLSCRGWNRRTISPLSGSTPAMFGPLNRLQWMHARARLSTAAVPPCCRAVMWSIWNGAGWNADGNWQYSQRARARCQTWRMRAAFNFPDYWAERCKARRPLDCMTARRLPTWR